MRSVKAFHAPRRPRIRRGLALILWGLVVGVHLCAGTVQALAAADPSSLGGRAQRGITQCDETVSLPSGPAHPGDTAGGCDVAVMGPPPCLTPRPAARCIPPPNGPTAPNPGDGPVGGDTDPGDVVPGGPPTAPNPGDGPVGGDTNVGDVVVKP